MSSDHIVAADYVGGALSPAERRAAEAHLQDCEQCQAAVDAARQVRGQEISRQRSGILFDFIGHLLQGSASLLGAPLRRIPSQPEPRPQEETEPPGPF